MDSDQSNKGIYIDGKNQAIDLLRNLSPEHRATILKNIGIKNPKLAEELVKKSISFEELNSLNDQKLKVVLSSFKPALVGLALKTCNPDFQKRVLTVINREQAEQVYDYMMTPTANQYENVQRAQKMIVESLGGQLL